MKRVLVYGISGGPGGVETVVKNIIFNADASEIGFDILTFYDNIEYADEYKKLGVNIYKITSRSENPVKNKKELKEFFRENSSKYYAVWCNLAELINIDVLKIAKKYRIKKRIIHSHSVASTRNKLLTMLHYFNRIFIGKIATDFWSCSLPAGKWFYNEKILNSDRFMVIKNAIYPEKHLFNEEIRRSAREELGIKEELVVGHVGRLSIGEKNTLFLLEIFKEILKVKPEAKLLLVGDGRDKQIVDEKIRELQIETAVVRFGHRSDVNRLMNAMDVFVLPSKMEGLGIVLIEAQSCGLPCFTSADVVPSEVKITEALEFISLYKTAEYWAKEIVSFKCNDRCSKTEEIVKAGYSIKEESKRVLELLVN
ncbi:MAG: glycosyltransferase family 1 protein [Ruminococcaceae bacterium]|nr:glycosyltransferase family 1 protein [Oscillospiraceae bacterium]